MCLISYENLDQMEAGKCLRLGDTIFTKVPEIAKEDSRWLNRSGKELWTNSHPPKNLPSICPDGADWNPPVHVLLRSWLQVLGAEYAHFCETRQEEPPWIHQASRELKDYLKFFRIVGCKDFFFVAPQGIPFSTANCGIFIESDLLTEDVAYALNLRRHRGLYQLNNLLFANEEGAALGIRFPQVRYPHAVFTKIHASLMAVNMELPLQLALDFEIANELHDWALTPATECLKMVDKFHLDEDMNFTWSFAAHPTSWLRLEKKYGLSRRRIADIIRDKHFLSPAKNIADRSAYLADDAWNFKVLHELTSHLVRLPANLVAAYKMIQSNPGICSIWDCVRLDKLNRVFLTNPEKYGQFLRLRALFFSGLYKNFHLRPRDAVVIHTIFDLRYDQTVHPGILRQIDDFGLQSSMAEYLEVSPAFIRSLSTRKPKVELFDDAKAATRREKHLIEKERVVFTVVEDLTGKSDPATDALIQTRHGAKVPFFKAFPQEAAEIERTMEIQKPVALLWIENPREIKPAILEKIYKFRLQELERRKFEET